MNNAPKPCAACGAPSVRETSRSWHCALHTRLVQMRTSAKYKGKVAPSIAALELLIPKDMACPACARRMNWLRHEGISTQATLQHDRCGTIRLLCQGCNSRHSAMPGDTFYLLPEGHKLCQDCGIIKSKCEFTKVRSPERRDGVQTYCKPCMLARKAAHRRRGAVAC